MLFLQLSAGRWPSKSSRENVAVFPSRVKNLEPTQSRHICLGSKILVPSAKSYQWTSEAYSPSQALPPTPASSSTKPVSKLSPTASPARMLHQSNTSLDTSPARSKNIPRGGESVRLELPPFWLDFRKKENLFCTRRIPLELIASGRLR